MIVFHLDVLATPSDTLITRQPSPEGRRLWNAMFETYMGRTIVVADEGTDLAVLQEWLKREGFKPSLIHIHDSVTRVGRTPRSEAVWFISSNIGTIHWYIDTDAACCADALRMGISTLLVAIPHFQRPEWHDKQDMRSWDAVVDELNNQAIKRSERSWDE